MWDDIAEAQLKTGEKLLVRRIRTPDRLHETKIRSLFPRHSQLWTWHLGLAFQSRMDDLEARFYIGILKGKLIGNVTTWEHGPIGVVAHLFTAKKYRRRGVCTAITKAVIQDFHNRGGKTVIGGFRPVSYPIAKKLGFKSVISDSEVMHLRLDPSFEREYFRAERVESRDAMWKDWPGIDLLFGVKEGWRLRSMKHKILGPYDYEDYFLQDMLEKHEGLCIPKVLVAEEGNIIGYWTLTLKPRGKDGFWLLDFFLHPTGIRNLDTVLDALTCPSGKIRCFVEEDCHEKRDALLNRGFKEKATRQFSFAGRTLHAIMMERRFDRSVRGKSLQDDLGAENA